MNKFVYKSRRNWRSIFILFALGVDICSVAVAALLAFYLREFIPGTPVVPASTFIFYAGWFGGVVITVALIMGVYRSAFHRQIRSQYFLAAKAYVYASLVILASLYLFQVLDFPRRFTFIMFGLLPFTFIFGRMTLNRFNAWMQKFGFGIYKTLVVGYDQKGLDILSRFQGFPELGYDIKGYVTRNGANGTKYPHYSFSDIQTVVNKEHIDRIFIPSSKLVTNGYSPLVELCEREQITLKVLSPEADMLLRLSRVHDLAGISLHTPEREHLDPLRRMMKRASDVAGSLILMILLSPVFLITAAAIYIESGGPIIFRQKRSAIKNGKVFDFYKFRSMVQDADELKDELMQFNESDGVLFKMRNDPRMTFVGRIIRKFSIDELPQLFNVFLGDMSLVGPRPLPLSDFDNLEEVPEFWDAIKDRGRAKPGMTGLWQISGRSQIGFREMVLLDLYYVENQSFLFDMEIMFETVPVVLFGKGAY